MALRKTAAGTETLGGKAASGRSQSSKSVESEPGIESIPGLGPIRARSLKKAGFENISQLRSATLEQLSAVPGITEIKANQLQEYLRGEKDTVGATPSTSPTAKPKTAKSSTQSPAAPAATSARKPRAAASPAPAKAPAEPTPLPAEKRRVKFDTPPAQPVLPPKPLPPDSQFSLSSQRVSALANSLLRTTGADSFDRGFARQIGKVAALAERLALEASSSPPGIGRAASQLQKVEDLLGEIAIAKNLSGKRQDRFADELRDRRHKLLEAFDSLDDLPAAAQKPAEPAQNKNEKSKKGDKAGKPNKKG